MSMTHKAFLFDYSNFIFQFKEILLKALFENNLPKLSYHGLIKENDDGSQEEQKIYPS